MHIELDPVTVGLELFQRYRAENAVKQYGSERMAKPLAVTTVAMLLAAMSGCGVLSDADEKFYFGGERQPEDLEHQYRALANELHSIKPCYLTHPQSVSKGAFGPVGSQVSLLRSRCFAVVAEGSGDERHCDKVRSASTEAAMSYRQDRSSTYWNEVQMTLLHTEEFFDRIGVLPGFGTGDDRAEMNALRWEPRQQRLWNPPEQRTHSAPELRVPPQSGQ